MILNLIEPCEILVDIGSDHGYLALEALLTHRARQVIASDVRIGPLKHAQKTFAKANVFENVTYVISDGLQAITQQPDAVTISGIGADLILLIINNDLDRFRSIPQIILQANTKLDLLRKSMTKLGFSLQREAIVLDGFFYIAQSYHYTGLCEELSEFQTYFGVFIDVDEAIYKDYLQNELQRMNHILKQYPHSAKHKRLCELIKTRLEKRVD